MTKKKKTILIITSIIVLTLIIIGTIVGIVLSNKYNTKAYGIKHKLLRSEITEARLVQEVMNNYVDMNYYLEMKLDYKITLHNTTDKDFIYNSDVLYLEVEDVEYYGGTTFKTYFKDNKKGEICFSEILTSNTTFTISPNNGIGSISGSLNVIIYFDRHNPQDQHLNEMMREIEFKLTYNGKKVGEFKPDILCPIERD